MKLVLHCGSNLFVNFKCAAIEFAPHRIMYVDFENFI